MNCQSWALDQLVGLQLGRSRALPPFPSLWLLMALPCCLESEAELIQEPNIVFEGRLWANWSCE